MQKVGWSNMIKTMLKELKVRSAIGAESERLFLCSDVYRYLSCNCNVK